MNFGPKYHFSEKHNPKRIATEPSFQVNSIETFENKYNMTERKKSCLNSPNITFLIRKFIQKLKLNMSFKILPRKKLPDLISLINDEAYELPQKKLNSFDNLKTLIHKILNNMIISPDHPLSRSWNFFLICYLVGCFIYIPFHISFQTDASVNFMFDNIMVIIFLFDILLNSLTGNFIKGTLIMNTEILLINYLKTHFVFDFLAFIYSIMEIINKNSDKNKEIPIPYLYNFLILAKIPRFLSCVRRMSNYLKLNPAYQEIIDLIKLISYVLFLAHILACLWYLCSTLNPKKNWIVSCGIAQEEIITKYLYSFYWVIVTMMTVGYGDITPQNDYEVLFSTFTIIFGCVLYAFNLNSIGIILQNRKKKENDLKKSIRCINNFMERTNIDIKLQRRVQEYLYFMWSEQSSSNNEEEILIINKLNETLKEELLLESYGGIFMNSPMFVKNFTEKSLRKMVRTIKEVKFFPGEEILEEGIVDDCSLYFINNGSVELYLNRTDSNSQNVLKICHKGETFGEHSFFTGKSRDFSCRSLGFTSVLKINKEMALNIFKENPEDYESYCLIKDQIIFDNNYSLLKYRCFYCRSSTHTIKDCNFLHFIPNIEKIVKFNDYYEEAPRKKYIRKDISKFSKVSILDNALKFNKIQKQRNLNNSTENKFLADEEFKGFKTFVSEYSGINEISKSNIIFSKLPEAESPSNGSIIESSPTNKENLNENKRDLTKLTINENDEKKFQSKLMISENDSVFEKMKIYTNYYPEMNFNKILEKIKFLRKIDKHVMYMKHEYLPINNLKSEIDIKLKKIQKYTIYIGKFRELIMRKFLQSFHSNIGTTSIICSPRRNKAFPGFFETKAFQEKSMGSLVMSVMNNKSLKKIKPKRFILFSSKKKKLNQ